MKIETIYIDSLYHCHRTNDGTMKAVETDFFDGKCDEYVKGFCYDTSKGYTAVYPWKPYSELAAAQAQYERDMADLQKAYREGVNSV